MQKGDVAQYGFWVYDELPDSEVEDWRKQAEENLTASAAYYRVKLGPFKWRELRPGQEDAGFPDETMQGSNFRMLVCEAEVVDQVLALPQHNFVSDLGFKDLQTLRKITREQWAQAKNVPVNQLSDDACDEVINELGPDVAEMLLKEAILATKH